MAFGSSLEKIDWMSFADNSDAIALAAVRPDCEGRQDAAGRDWSTMGIA